MYSFEDITLAPVEVSIDGKVYKFPRFTQSDFVDWASHTRRNQMEDAMAIANVTEREDKVRMAAYFSPPPLDLYQQHQNVRTAEGSAYIVKACAKKAGVPQAGIERVMALKPFTVRALAMELSNYEGMESELVALYGTASETVEDKDRPLAEATSTSSDALTTGGTPSNASSDGSETA